VGSRSKVNLAYIAGFLDGDGSLMLQIKKRKDGISKVRFMSTICFYQDTRHEETLKWIRDVLEIGYLTRRNDGMSELRINGYASVKDILTKLVPFLRFKRVQARELLSACTLLSSRKYKPMQKKHLVDLVDKILVIQNENYATRKKKTREQLLQMLRFDPVTT